MDGFGAGEAQLTARTSHAATAPPSRRPTGMARRGDFGGCGNDGAGVTLQSCRPLSGAVISLRPDLGWSTLWLQSCRPLSGAVIVNMPYRYTDAAGLQSCRPLSGAVMRRPLGQARRILPGFNRAAPFRERLCGKGYCTRLVTQCFNRAAPFRERLSDHRLRPLPLGSAASIVPPPFGSGYNESEHRAADGGNASIVPPPFGSGYNESEHRAADGGNASIVPPPFGSGYRATSTRAAALP